MASLSAQGWGWQFAARSTPALSNISFEISAGERVLVLGASGVGKSTLLRALAGVLGEDEGTQHGSVLVNGQPPAQSRGQIGLVLQDPENQVILERVGDDIAFGCENLGIPREEIWKRVAQSCELVGLNVPLEHSTSALSGGQKQRLALAGVLAMQPEVIALDEPTANLDPEGALALKAALEQIVDSIGATIVMVEHRVELWWDFATRVIVLGAHGVLWDGAPSAMPSEQAAEFEKEGIWLPHVRQARHRVQTGAEVLMSTRQLKVGYPGSPLTQPVLDLEVKQGNVLAVMGPNGVGKTALALTLGGLIPAHSGTVEASSRLSGALSSTEPIRWRSRELLNRIGSVFQAPEQQFITATVRDELCAGPRAVKMPPEQIDAQVEMLLDRLHLRELANAHPFTLSGGQQRRLSVGTALATKPPLVVLDEPTFGQDASTWAEMVALIGELRDEGHGIVAVTHDQAFVEAVADSAVHVGASNGTH